MSRKCPCNNGTTCSINIFKNNFKHETTSEMVSTTGTYILHQHFPPLANSISCPSFSFCWDILPKQCLNYFFFHMLILHLFRSATLLIRQFYETFLKHLAHSSWQRLHYFITIFFKRAASTTWWANHRSIFTANPHRKTKSHHGNTHNVQRNIKPRQSTTTTLQQHTSHNTTCSSTTHTQNQTRRTPFSSLAGSAPWGVCPIK